MTSFKKNPKNTLTKWGRTAIIAGLFGALAVTATGCEGSAEEAGETTQNVIKEVNEAYGNVREGVDKTKTWVNTKVDQAEQATEDVQKAAESLNNAVNSLREFTNFGGEDEQEPAPDGQSTQTSGEAE